MTYNEPTVSPLGLSGMLMECFAGGLVRSEHTYEKPTQIFGVFALFSDIIRHDFKFVELPERTSSANVLASRVARILDRVNGLEPNGIDSASFVMSIISRSSFIRSGSNDAYISFLESNILRTKPAEHARSVIHTISDVVLDVSTTLPTVTEWKNTIQEVGSEDIGGDFLYDLAVSPAAAKSQRSITGDLRLFRELVSKHA